MDVLIIGAGGHAKVVEDILRRQSVDIVGFLDDDPSVSIPENRSNENGKYSGTIDQKEDSQ